MKKKKSFVAVLLILLLYILTPLFPIWHLLRICVVVYESTSDVMNLFIKLQLFIKLALASTHPQYLCLSWTRLVTLVDSYIQATTSFINFVEYVRAFDVSL